MSSKRRRIETENEREKVLKKNGRRRKTPRVSADKMGKSIF
jgi:hypothetical protein